MIHLRRNPTTTKGSRRQRGEVNYRWRVAAFESRWGLNGRHR